MSPAVRDRIRAALPNTMLIDAVGSSEAGSADDHPQHR